MGIDATALIELYRRMCRIRQFEQRVAELYRDGHVPGFVHLSIGQEAAAVGACHPLRRDDVITSTHRGHGHCIAKGLGLEPMFAELLARETGACAGLGGSMHVADPTLGIFGANGIVAAGLPIAVGAAAAARVSGTGRVTVAFFGDGVLAQGAFHEAANLAAVWRLPVVFFCENNHYAEFSTEASQHPVGMAARAAAYGMPYAHVSGNDVAAVAEVVGATVERVRAGAGPAFVEADTYRWHGHYEGDPERYRTPEEVEEARQGDPLLVTARQLVDLGVAAERVAAIGAAVTEELEQALARAMAAPAPSMTTATTAVFAPHEQPPEPTPPPTDAPTFRTMDAVRLALETELEDDPSVLLAGIDIAAGGNVFGVTRGLASRWPDRVLDTPISETAIVGMAVGAAMAGMRPVVEIMYLDFIGVCFDQILNQAAKLRFMTGGRATMGLTIRTQFGAGRSSGSQHSQSLEALLAHIPGLKVVMPSTPADAYGLLRAAIAEPNPVIFIENRHLYGLKGPQPPRDHLVPIGKARVVRPGSDVTLVSWSRMVHDACEAADLVAAEGIDTEVIDLRTISPLDREAILASVGRTGRLVIAHEAVQDFGVGAEIAATVATSAFWSLDAPIRRVGAPSTPVPYAPTLEAAWLPSVATIADALRETARA